VIKTWISLLLFSLAGSSLLFADGGTVQIQQQAGPFIVTLFSEPTPVRVGPVDLSVLCQKSSDRTAITDADVLIHLRKPGKGDITEFVLVLGKSKVKNQLYAANANLPSAGRWPVRINVKRGNEEATVSGSMEVLPPQPAMVTYWPLFVGVPLLALLFAINLRLRRRRRAARRP
jgi:hypothetical protein